MKTQSIVEISELYAIKCHESTGHMYSDNIPYKNHLLMVYMNAIPYLYLLNPLDRDTVSAACWTHDVIEDCRQTYNDVKDNTNASIAELTYLVTAEKGRTRSERMNEKYYSGIRSNELAIFVKVCDRIANVRYSIDTNNTKMTEMYINEMENFFKQLYIIKYNPLFNYLYETAYEKLSR